MNKQASKKSTTGWRSRPMRKQASKIGAGARVSSPLRVTVGILKGGASRTTTAVYIALAEHARMGGRVLLVDADPANGTAFEWAEDARVAGGGWPDGVEVVYWPVSSLARRVAAVVDEYAAVVIDTGNDSVALRAALEVTDHLVVPIAPTGTESTRLTPTLQVAAEVAQRRPIELSLLLTRARARTRSLSESRRALEVGLELRVLTAEVQLLERIAGAYGTAPKDLSPYTEVVAELHEIGERA